MLHGYNRGATDSVAMRANSPSTKVHPLQSDSLAGPGVVLCGHHARLTATTSKKYIEIVIVTARRPFDVRHKGICP